MYLKCSELISTLYIYIYTDVKIRNVVNEIIVLKEGFLLNESKGKLSKQKINIRELKLNFPQISDIYL